MPGSAQNELGTMAGAPDIIATVFVKLPCSFRSGLEDTVPPAERRVSNTLGRSSVLREWRLLVEAAFRSVLCPCQQQTAFTATAHPAQELARINPLRL